MPLFARLSFLPLRHHHHEHKTKEKDNKTTIKPPEHAKTTRFYINEPLSKETQSNQNNAIIYDIYYLYCHFFSFLLLKTKLQLLFLLLLCLLFVVILFSSCIILNIEDRYFIVADYGGVIAIVGGYCSLLFFCSCSSCRCCSCCRL